MGDMGTSDQPWATSDQPLGSYFVYFPGHILPSLFLSRSAKFQDTSENEKVVLGGRREGWMAAAVRQSLLQGEESPDDGHQGQSRVSREPAPAASRPEEEKPEKAGEGKNEKTRNGNSFRDWTLSLALFPSSVPRRRMTLKARKAGRLALAQTQRMAWPS